MIYRYQMHGLSIASEIEWPFVPELINPHENAELTIRLVSEIPVSPSDKSQVLRVLEPGDILLDIPKVGRYRLLRGEEILVLPVPNARPEMIRLFLLGTAIGISLQMRGILPLHASGMLHEEGAVLFIGDSGAGKSTLLETFRLRGRKLLSDDVCALRLREGSPPLVSPSVPRVHLCHDAASYLNISTESCDSAHPEKNKYVLSRPDSFHGEAIPLKKIYALLWSKSGELCLEEPPLADIISFFILNTYRLSAWVKIQGEQSLFQLCAKLAKENSVSMLSRPRDFTRMEDVCRLIEEDLQRTPPEQQQFTA